MAHFRSFSRAVERLNIHPSSPVAVAVSGGCDSLALTILAKEVFNKVTGITVDHKLRAESGDDAVRVGELVRGFGVDHHTVSLDWGPGGAPEIGKVQLLAREKRYAALLETCKQMNINTLLVGHHQDDQNETFILRMSKGSGIGGLAGMSPVSYWPGFPSTQVVRPLLDWKKRELVEVCRSEGVEWVEDLSNSSHEYLRNLIRATLADYPDITSGLPQLMASCADARSVIQQRVNEATLSLPTHIPKLGCVCINKDQLKSLPQFVATRVLLTLTRYVTGTKASLNYRTLRHIYHKLPLSRTMTIAGDCALVPINQDTLCFAKGLPRKGKQISTPIQVGEPLLWDNRWLVTLKSNQPNDSRMFKVRHLTKVDWRFCRQGLRKIRNSSLPHETIRGGFPVITDERDKVVTIPHLQVIDGSYRISCELQFQPRYELEQLLKNYGP